MLRKILKWVGLGLVAIFLVLLLAYGYIYLSTENRIDTKYSVKEDPITLSTDSAVLAKGAHLVTIKGCNDCHGANLGGKVFIDDPALGRIVAANLTRGKGGLPASYGAADWLVALRHGVNREGFPLWFMPSYETVHISKSDMTAMLSYLQTIPPVDSNLPTSSMGVLGRILTHFDQIPMFAAEMIDHNMGWPKEVTEEVSVTYGKYLTVACSGCHRADLKGGKPVAPGFPPVPDITSTGRIGQMTEEQFISTLRTGTTPEGRALKLEDMPWNITSKYTDTELKAVYAFLKSQ